MQPLKLTYRDLLQYIKKDKLDKFMGQLKTVGSLKKSRVTLLTGVEQPVYYDNIYYHTALCCAVAVNQPDIAQALLNIGADPNLTDLNTAKGSALLIAARSKYSNAGLMLRMLLNAPGIELYVIDALGRSVFLCAKGRTDYVLDLLTFDPIVSGLTKEEKQVMSNTIAEATKSKSAHQTNTAICQSLKSVYLSDDEQKFVKNKMEDACPSITSGQPIGDIVLSYLFKPKPHSLKVMENWLSHNKAQSEPQSDPQDEKNMICRIS